MEDGEDADDVEDDLDLTKEVRSAFDAKRADQETEQLGEPSRHGPLDEQAELERQANGWAIH